MTVKLRYKLNQGKPASPAKPVSRAARMLALAHLIERKVESGEIQSYATAARALGMSRARVSQIMALLNLPVQTQEAILLGKLDLGERRLRGMVGNPSSLGRGE